MEEFEAQAHAQIDERRCVYCGEGPLLRPKKDWPQVCRAHADLPLLDPAYPHLVGLPDQWATLRS